MSIADSNLFTRNLYGDFARKKLTPRQESSMAKIVSLFVKFAALAFALKLPASSAIEMQLLGGIWITQIFPSVVLGAFTRWFRPWALLIGWIAGMSTGTWMAWQLNLKSSVYPLHFHGQVYAMYAAIPALALNLIVSAGLTLLFQLTNTAHGTDETDPEETLAALF